MALVSTSVNLPGVSTEEMLTETAKKGSLAPEDDTIFVDKNTSQLGYERVWVNEAKFDIQSNGKTNSIQLQHNSYPLRTDTAYLAMTFKITLNGTANDNACPGQLFPLLACNSFRMRIGQNQQEIISPNEHTIYKFIQLMQSNLSNYDKYNMGPMFNFYPDLNLNDAINRQKVAFMLGFDTFVAGTPQTRQITFNIPLTYLRDMFNHHTLLPVGTRIQFDFQVDAACNSNAIVNGVGSLGGTFEFLPTSSYIRSEHPERDPAIMMAQLANREYLSEGLNYETFRADIRSGLNLVNIPILRPGSKMPAKIDFGFIETSTLNSNKDIMSFKGFGISEIEVNANGPFPSVKTFSSATGGSLKDWSDNKSPFDRLPYHQSMYNQMDTFQIDKWGESYNNETTYDPIFRINPYIPLMIKTPFTKPSNDAVKIAENLFNSRQIFTAILAPSNLMDGSAYPTVEGSLDMCIKFCDPLAVPITLYMCLQYWQQTILHEDHTCEIQNITLENFRTSGLSTSNALPPIDNDDEEMDNTINENRMNDMRSQTS